MGWVVLSFFIALVLDSISLGATFQAFNPPWTVLVLIYWCWVLPAQVGPFTGFCVGLLLDVLSAGLLGLHALGGSLVGLLTNRLRVILGRSTLWRQALVVWGMVLSYKAVVGWIQSLFTTTDLDFVYWLSSLVVVLAWPVVYTLLKELTPIKRRA